MPTKLQNEDKSTLTMSDERTRDERWGAERNIICSVSPIHHQLSKPVWWPRGTSLLETNLSMLAPPSYSEQVQRKESQVNQNKGKQIQIQTGDLCKELPTFLLLLLASFPICPPQVCGLHVIFLLQLIDILTLKLPPFTNFIRGFK